MTAFGEWKIWNGGGCPVGPEVMVQVQLYSETRAISEASAPMQARCFEWNNSYHIIAYREVIEPFRETVTMYGCRGGVWTTGQVPTDTHRIMFDVIAEEIDCAGCRMEKL